MLVMKVKTSFFNFSDSTNQVDDEQQQHRLKLRRQISVRRRQEAGTASDATPEKADDVTTVGHGPHSVVVLARRSEVDVDRTPGSP